MKRREKIELILIFKRSIDLLVRDKISYICGTINIMKYSDEFEGKFKEEDLNLAMDYLYSEIPTSTYNKTFYEHRLYNKTNPYFIDNSEQSREWPWWVVRRDMADVFDYSKEDEFLQDEKEVRQQRILFLRILINKLNK